ncbi:MEDS domain-containing protein [Nonomuraea sp. NPDC046570]|uniref:MEDS domain-containing protein n=1 Tax=Nonomuraea sp. NPDC046570 TaxID=3155255 RepID=UPI0033C92510
MTPFAHPRFGDHLCLPYDSDGERLAFSVAYVGSAMRTGRKVLVHTDALSPAAMRTELSRSIPRLAAAEAGGQVEITCSAGSHLAGGVFDAARSTSALTAAVREALRSGWSGVCVLADMGWAARDSPGAEDLFAYEAAINPLFAVGGLAAACLYDRRLFPPDRMREASAAHPLTPGQAELRFIATPPRLILFGEADLTNAPALAGLLAPLGAGRDDVTLDARQLSFADLAAMRELIALGGRTAGTTTVLAGASLSHLLRLLGAGDQPGFSVREGDHG